jgi:hypothetical protein
MFAVCDAKRQGLKYFVFDVQEFRGLMIVQCPFQIAPVRRIAPAFLGMRLALRYH